MGKNEKKDQKKCVKVQNENLKLLESDHFHHFGFSSTLKHFNTIFSDLKFVITGGSATRMKVMANKLVDDLDLALAPGTAVQNLCQNTDRFVMYKVGPVLFVNHGMGMGSIMIMLHEVIKALYYSQAEGVSMLRVGTSGGIGLPGGSIVLTSEALDSALRNYLEVPVLGKVVQRKCELSAQLRADLLACVGDEDYAVTEGKTICSWDFYEGQARLDGAVCAYTEAEKMAFLQKAHGMGVRNLEMEAQAIAYICKEADIDGAVVCVTYLNRLEQDQIHADHDTLNRWQERPMTLVTKLIKKRLASL